MPDSTRATIVDRLTERLVRASGESGGWPYYDGKQPRLESTCWALLALGDSPRASALAFERHVAYLGSRQVGAGLLVDIQGAPPNLAVNGLCAWTVLAGVAPDAAWLPRLVNAIVATKGVATPQGPSPQDNSLQAWPWLDGTFSWVEPTAWCLLALKKSRGLRGISRIEPRIDEAERLLADRVCRGGGWNYGNAAMFEQDLRPYVPTTALGLLALQDRPAWPAVADSVRTLGALWRQERSTYALALTVLALHRLGHDTSEVEAALADAVPRAEASGHVLGMAMAVAALARGGRVLEALRV